MIWKIVKDVIVMKIALAKIATMVYITFTQIGNVKMVALRAHLTNSVLNAMMMIILLKMVSV